MMTRSFRRKTILFLLVAVLATPWVCAAGSRAAESVRPAQAARFDLLTQLWNTVRSLWSAEGCGMDPDGRCLPQPQLDAGCGADPNGRCSPGS
jgi:hypothetical protein